MVCATLGVPPPIVSTCFLFLQLFARLVFNLSFHAFFLSKLAALLR